MKHYLLVLFLVLGYSFSDACTTFFIHKDGKMVFGRNYDWMTGNGMVCTNQRGLAKTSAKTQDGETISWISKYGSITFNQYGKEFPTGGMNEKGLVVELMWLDGTEYPKPDNRPSIGVLQWIQYQLDNCSTVDELIATDSKLRIASVGTTPLHYLVADANGNAATIEYMNGKMLVHTGKDLPVAVLTNDSYASALKQTNAGTNKSKSTFSFGNNSIDRFARACDKVKEYSTADGSVIDYSFSILTEVAQGSHTKWSIVYDVKEKKVYFKSLAFPNVKHIAFSDFDFRCSQVSKAWDLNQAGQGAVAGLFKPFSLEMNDRIVSRSLEESKSQITVSEESRSRTVQYPGSITCKTGE